jgi:hypothetical protein
VLAWWHIICMAIVIGFFVGLLRGK